MEDLIEIFVASLKTDFPIFKPVDIHSMLSVLSLSMAMKQWAKTSVPSKQQSKEEK